MFHAGCCYEDLKARPSLVGTCYTEPRECLSATRAIAEVAAAPLSDLAGLTSTM